MLPLKSLGESLFHTFLLFFGVAGTLHRFLACISPVFASLIPWPPRVSVCLNFAYFIRVPVIGLGSILTQDDLVLT